MARTARKKDDFHYEYPDTIKRAMEIFTPQMEKVEGIFRTYMENEHEMAKENWDFLYSLMKEMSGIIVSNPPFISFELSRLEGLKYKENRTTLYHVRAEGHARGFLKMVEYIREYGNELNQGDRFVKSLIAAQHVFFFIITEEK